MNLLDSPVSLTILAIIIISSLIGFSSPNQILTRFSLNPYSIVHYRKYYQIVTHVFIHLDWMHLLFNALTFYFFAPQLEFAIGSERFALVFITAGIVASFPSIVKNKDNPNYYSLGASGAIAGVLFSFILFYPTSRIYMFFIPIGIPAPIFALIYLGYCVYASKYHSTNINHEAHFWGAVWGLFITIVMFPNIVEYFIQTIKHIF
ncbi:rhomboid family intramembrane serine protease [Bacteroidetes/Chlorobi group bacterium Naka2016]|jgi:membrane associated rhomboid family serine protease|nr:MAG: rhomboid family intramembrane serine protease [Bacteroidetes/Chlorobi group bacterium Naka2016]